MPHLSSKYMDGSAAPSNADRTFIDAFVKEYVIDHNSYAACLRMNFGSECAMESANRLMGDFDVLDLIEKAEAERTTATKGVEGRDLLALPSDFTPGDEVNDKKRIIAALFKEAFDKAPESKQSARVSALGKLSDIYKLTKEEAIDNSVCNVMIVPAVPTVDDWEANAIDQQTELKATVKD